MPAVGVGGGSADYTSCSSWIVKRTKPSWATSGVGVVVVEPSRVEQCWRHLRPATHSPALSSSAPSPTLGRQLLCLLRTPQLAMHCAGRVQQSVTRYVVFVQRLSRVRPCDVRRLLLACLCLYCGELCGWLVVLPSRRCRCLRTDPPPHSQHSLTLPAAAQQATTSTTHSSSSSSKQASSIWEQSTLSDDATIRYQLAGLPISSTHSSHNSPLAPLLSCPHIVTASSKGAAQTLPS